jgi:hypothetical protein
MVYPWDTPYNLDDPDLESKIDLHNDPDLVAGEISFARSQIVKPEFGIENRYHSTGLR